MDSAVVVSAAFGAGVGAAAEQAGAPGADIQEE